MTGYVGFAVREQDLHRRGITWYFAVDTMGLMWNKPEEAGASWIKLPLEEA
ncbi:hypothetical protein K6V98_03470 [Collinsella sp. AGMB00827]|uniref:Uncharacterized protein n=1 Tax=Collinsella ureilytica TaxID=2869515 RepID=A0ABS7MK19_9ACTN|nr:hypothetical protein [Collinsella urealyticum]MBY4797421.1 hypothetical protein [Collinsella urealyticum]